ncbi:hypothetical protein JCM8208_006205 [Rhodotorula glutinis]
MAQQPPRRRDRPPWPFSRPASVLRGPPRLVSRSPQTPPVPLVPASPSPPLPPPVPAIHNGLPPRLPSELILDIIEWCDKLPEQRAATLAALCRLAKPYQADAERALYSDVRLSWGDRSNAQPDPAEPVPPGLVLHTLVHNARLRPLVKSLEVALHGAEGSNLEVTALLGDLPGVETYSTERYPGASSRDQLGGLRRVVSNDAVRIRTLDVGTWTSTTAALVRDRPQAFSTLKHLKLERLYDHQWVGISGPSVGIETLSLEVNVGPRAFASLTSPFSKTLLSLRLPVVGTEAAQGVKLRPFVKLERLDLLVPKKERGPAFQDAIPNVVALLLSAASLRHLVSLTIQETVVQPPLDYLGPPPESTQLSMSAHHILNAVPFQIQQLTLDAPAFLATDLVDWILSPCRPPALKSLRIGGETSVGLNKLLRRTTGRYSELARKLDESGIEVTTLPCAADEAARQ